MTLSRRDALQALTGAAAFSLLPLELAYPAPIVTLDPQLGGYATLESLRAQIEAMVREFGKRPLDSIPSQYTRVFDRVDIEHKDCPDCDKDLDAHIKFKIMSHTPGFEGDRFTFVIPQRPVGLGFAVTSKARENPDWMAKTKETTQSLLFSFAQAREIEAAAVLNNAGRYDACCGGDGVALVSHQHPYDFGTWSNTFDTPMELNESSLLAAEKAIERQFVDESGLRILAMARTLVVPQALEPIAIRLLRTNLRPGTAQSDVNVIPEVPEYYVVMNYLTSTKNWFLRTNVEGLQAAHRTQFEITVESGTSDVIGGDIFDNILITGYERRGFGVSDPRAIFGSLPA